nr:hypothetical protein Hi04_10k_c5016_00019 [uncultured bacterium]
MSSGSDHGNSGEPRKGFLRRITDCLPFKDLFSQGTAYLIIWMVGEPRHGLVIKTVQD